MAAVGPSVAFAKLLEALRKQYEQDVAYARKQSSIDTGQEPAFVASMTAESGPQTEELEAAIPGMVDLHPHSTLPPSSNGRMMQVVPIDTGSVSSDTAPPSHIHKPRKQPQVKQLEGFKSPAASYEQELANLPPLQRFVNSSLFDKISAALLVSNSLFIAIQVEFLYYEGSNDWIDVVDMIYCVLFIIELGMRLLGFGCRKFWCDPGNKWWNIFDFFVVTLSTMDTVVSYALKGQSTPLSSISVLRVVRIVRIVRVLRIIQVLKFFQDLRILIASIVSTLKTAMFAFMLILMIIFMFAIGISQLTAEYIESRRVEGNPVDAKSDLMFFYGSVPKTIFSLFMTIAGGIDWKDAVVPLMNEVGATSFFFYLLFVVLMILCVMNVLVGIFCQSAIDTAQSDKENVIRLQLQEKKDYIQTLKALFAMWDDSKDGKCNRKEFENHIHDEETEKLLRTLEIDARDALTLFELLDGDASGAIDLDEFITGCITLRGGAKAVHMEKLASTSTQLIESMELLQISVEIIKNRVMTLDQKVSHQGGRAS